jgi:sigma-E factor negative regulatory protein RseB
VIVEHRAVRQFFPMLAPDKISALTQYYIIRTGTWGRVAGVGSRQLVIKPKDSFRFGHEFWIEPETGLLLKASLIGESGVVLENFTFTEVKIGGPISAATVQYHHSPEHDTWQEQRVASSELRVDDGQWLFRNPLPGFRHIARLKRQLRPDAPVSTQFIFSDGLASFSLFIEPLGKRAREEASIFSDGAVNVYKRQIAAYQIILLGDIPVTALRYFGDGIAPRSKNE